MSVRAVGIWLFVAWIVVPFGYVAIAQSLSSSLRVQQVGPVDTYMGVQINVKAAKNVPLHSVCATVNARVCYPILLEGDPAVITAYYPTICWARDSVAEPVCIRTADVMTAFGVETKTP